METISSSAARQSISKTLSTVLNDRVPIRITNKRLGSVIVMPEDEFNSWQETIYLLKSPANAKRLLEGMEALDRRKNTIEKTQEELNKLA